MFISRQQLYDKIKLPADYNKLSSSRRKLVREKYIIKQGGLCHYCGKPLTEPPVKDREINHDMFPKGFFNYPIHLHHNHYTGMTIGAVHAYCNAVLWQYEGE